MSSKRNDAGSDIEASLLASVGGSVKEMNTYESSVLREATLDSAPTLTGVGFPDLAPISPSYDARRRSPQAFAVDLPHVKTVLSKVRIELSQQKHDNHRSHVLRIKEQILLVYLKKFAKIPREEMPVHIHREIKAEKQWSQRVRNSTGPPVSREPSSSHSKDDDARPSGPPMGKRAIMERHTRLHKRRRISMMAHKAAGAATNENEDEGPQEEDEEVDEEKERAQSISLREKRRERDARKKRRRGQLVEEESDEEQEFDDSPAQINDGQTNEERPDRSGTPPERDSEEKQSEPCHSTPLSADHRDEKQADDVGESRAVACPLCNAEVSVPKGQNADEVLSRHIAQCQQGGRVTRGRRRRQVQSYSELDDDDKDNEKVDVAIGSDASEVEAVLEEHEPARKQRKKTSIRSAKKAPPVPTSSAMDDLDEWAYEDRVDEWKESGLKTQREMSEHDKDEEVPGAELYPGDLLVPAWMNNRLFSYQRIGLRWMWELHKQGAGGIVGDEMGLGKTVQVCSFLGAMVGSRKLRSALIICPATMLQHWLKELSVWAPGLRRVLIHKSGESDGRSRNITASLLRRLRKWLKSSRADRLNEAIDEQDYVENDEDSFCGTGYTVVTTYENIRRSADIWVGHDWSYVVLDEGQKIRNPDADVTLACKRLRTPHRLLLSGTPIQNDLRELWSLFDFAFPGRLGTLPAFETEFAEPIKRGGYSNASPMQVQLAYRCALVLKDMINPYLLRRQKKEIKEVSRMPGKTEQVLFCRLSNRQRSLYEAYLRSDEVLRILRGSPQLFKSITILRKICNHPDLASDPDEDAEHAFVKESKSGLAESDESEPETVDSHDDTLVERSGKLQVLAKILPLWQEQGHRVLIFCQWKKMLSIIQRFTQSQGWSFLRLDGDTAVGSRQRLVDKFNSDESYFGMLMTTRTGGVGLNLTGANRIILYDPDWNPQTDAQARERAWRFGQKRAVTVYRLITAGTIEEKIYQRQIFKTALTNRVLQDPRQRRLFSQRDLRDFFTLQSDDGAVSRGGHGVTQVGEITKGDGVVTPSEVKRAASQPAGANGDDNETLESVMKSKGLAGVFDHDFVVSSGSKRTSVREMEEQAKTVADRAAKVLQSSVSSSQRFQPTWTGSDETKSRFGHSRYSQNVASSPTDKVVSVVPKAGFGSNGGAPSSKQLFASILKNRSEGPTSKNSDADISKYASLMERIKTFISLNGQPTTDDILREFESVPNCDAAIFRRLLNSVAVVKRGKWQLK